MLFEEIGNNFKNKSQNILKINTEIKIVALCIMDYFINI